MADEAPAPVTETATTAETPTTDAAPATPAVDAAAADGTTILGGGDAPSTEGGDPSTDAPAAPAAPEKYEVKAPEGTAFDAAAFEIAEPVLRDLNLSNDQAQKLVDVYPKLIEHFADRAVKQQENSAAAYRAEWAKAAQEDPEIGGGKFEESKALAAKALDGLGFVKDTPFRKLLDESGLGNHPDMLRAWRKVGEAIGDDSFVRGQQGVQSEVPIWDRIYNRAQA